MDRVSVLISTVESLRESEAKLRERLEEQRHVRLRLEKELQASREHSTALERQHMAALRGSAKNSLSVKTLQDRVSQLEHDIQLKEKVIHSLQMKPENSRDSSVQSIERHVLRLEAEIKNLQVSQHSELGIYSAHNNRSADVEPLLERETRLRSLLQNQLKEAHAIHEGETARLRKDIERLTSTASEAREKFDELRVRLQEVTLQRDDAMSRISDTKHENRILEGKLVELSDHVTKYRDEANLWISDARRQFDAQHAALIRERDTLLEGMQSKTATMEDYAALESHKLQRARDDLQDATHRVMSLEQENASLRARLELAEEKAIRGTFDAQDGRSVSVTSYHTDGHDDVRATVRRLEAENRSLSQTVEMLTDRLTSNEYTNKIGDLLVLDEQLQKVSTSLLHDSDTMSAQLDNLETQVETIRRQIHILQNLYDR